MVDENAPAQMTPAELEMLNSLGWDAPRFWCNSFAVSQSPGIALLVAREQVNFQREDGTSPAVAKNVTSIVMPESAITELRDLLNRIYPQDAAA